MNTSLRLNTILLATDFLESSRLALDYAVAFAHHYQAKLLMVHVFHMPQAAAEAEVFKEGPSISRKSRETRLEAFASGAGRAGVDVQWSLVEGWMPEALHKKVEAIKPDLLVLGTHGVYRGLSHMLIGSNAEELLLSAPCPTLTVGRHVPAGIGPDSSFEYILYVTDFTPESAAAAPYAVGLGQDFNARLEVCHLLAEQADKSDEVQHRRAERYCEAVRRTLPNGEAFWCSPADQLAQGARADEILQRTRDDSAGLIVLGVKGESQFARHLHTSLAFQLVATAACPVFTICG